MISSHFSPGTEILDAILARLETCSSEIDICVYTLSDDRLMDAILQCHREGITLRILSDNDKMFDQGSDIQMLHRAGLAVKVDNSPAHMHHKFMVVDRSTVLTGSYNWTRSAATKNAENLVVIEDQETARQFTEEFERLWQQASCL